MNYKYYISLVVSMLFMINTFACNDAKLHCNSTHACTDTSLTKLDCHLEASVEVDRRFTPPQNGLLAMRSASLNTPENAVFECTYYNFTNEEALIAFQYAISIWEANISSFVPIRVSVNWSRDLPDYALAGCAPSAYEKNAYGLPLNNIIYPSALYNKLIQEDNATIIDMAIDINAEYENWYFGIDGNTPEDKYDFVTVILHELSHGLGFNGSAVADLGFEYNYSSYLSIFDHYMEDEYGVALGDKSKYAAESDELIAAFTNPVFFNGDLAKEANGGKSVGLYSPETFSTGSSLYHLDTIYNDDDQNSLLTHQLKLGRAIHTPGPVLLGMLKDLGWDLADVSHASNDTDDESTTSKILEFQAQSEYGLNADDMTCFYRKAGEKSYNSATVENNGSNLFTATATGLVYGETYQYYFEVKDMKGDEERTYNYPPDAVIYPLSFFFGQDTEAPYILAITNDCPIWVGVDSTKLIRAYAYDNGALATVNINWFIDGVEQAPVAMEYDDELSLYAGLLPLPSDLSGDAEIKYGVTATDASSLSNTVTFPEDEYYYADVTGFSELTENLSLDFESADHADHCLLNGMDISSVDGFTGYALNTEHPYLTDDASGFTLCHTFTIGANTTISFDEIVLVEQAYTGITYPSTLFYDYVVVEASTDGGENWSPVEDGYDASYYDKWDEFWYTDIQNIESTYPCSEAFGTPDLYKRHTMTFDEAYFEVGDEVIIRFRLESDMVITGWGWNIDNLEINLGNSADITNNKVTTIGITPNPARDYINIDSDITSQVTFFSLSGKTLKQSTVAAGENIYVGDLPLGVVLVKVENESGVYTSKLIRE